MHTAVNTTVGHNAYSFCDDYRKHCKQHSDIPVVESGDRADGQGYLMVFLR